MAVVKSHVHSNGPLFVDFCLALSVKCVLKITRIVYFVLTHCTVIHGSLPPLTRIQLSRADPPLLITTWLRGSAVHIHCDAVLYCDQNRAHHVIRRTVIYRYVLARF